MPRNYHCRNSCQRKRETYDTKVDTEGRERNIEKLLCSTYLEVVSCVIATAGLLGHLFTHFNREMRRAINAYSRSLESVSILVKERAYYPHKRSADWYLLRINDVTTKSFRNDSL